MYNSAVGSNYKTADPNPRFINISPGYVLHHISIIRPIGTRAVAICLILVCVGCRHKAPLEQKQLYISPKCPWPGALVHDREAARTIGQMIVQGFYTPTGQNFPSSDLDKRHPPAVIITDKGQSWGMAEYRRNIYGGGITFDLSKCNAEVTNFRLDKD